MIPRYRPPLSAGDLRLFLRLKPGDPQPFETEFGRKFGYADVVWFPYARVAIQAWLQNVSASPAQAVVSPFNCVALGNAMVQAGWKARYIDTGQQDFNSNPTTFVEALAQADVHAGIAVSLWGIPMELPRVNKPILFDYALRGLDPKPASLGDRDAVVYSLNWGKPFTGFKGAFLCSGSVEAAAPWRRWRDRSMRRSSRRQDLLDALLLRAAFTPALFGATAWLRTHLNLGSRLSGMRAAEGQNRPADWDVAPSEGLMTYGMRRLEALEESRLERQVQVERYLQRLAPVMERGIQLSPPIPWLSHFPLRLKKRDDLNRFLLRRGIFSSAALYDRLLSDYPWMAGSSGAVDYPQARRLTRETLHLPLYPGLSEQDQEKVCQAVLDASTKL